MRPQFASPFFSDRMPEFYAIAKINPSPTNRFCRTFSAGPNR